MSFTSEHLKLLTQFLMNSEKHWYTNYLDLCQIWKSSYFSLWFKSSKRSLFPYDLISELCNNKRGLIC